jgi:DNA mismatch endonuclease (patch repair protein)
MARIRGAHTTPEKTVRSLAHRSGYRYRLHRRDLPGTPDLVFPRLRKVIFVHGCFWHRHPGCRMTTTPKTRREFWQKKFDGNVRRDARAMERLNESGWEVLVVWECETRSLPTLTRKLDAFLGGSGAEDIDHQRGGLSSIRATLL